MSIYQSPVPVSGMFVRLTQSSCKKQTYINKVNRFECMIPNKNSTNFCHKFKFVSKKQSRRFLSARMKTKTTMLINRLNNQQMSDVREKASRTF